MFDLVVGEKGNCGGRRNVERAEIFFPKPFPFEFEFSNPFVLLLPNGVVLC